VPQGWSCRNCVQRGGSGGPGGPNCQTSERAVGHSAAHDRRGDGPAMCIYTCVYYIGGRNARGVFRPARCKKGKKGKGEKGKVGASGRVRQGWRWVGSLRCLGAARRGVVGGGGRRAAQSCLCSLDLVAVTFFLAFLLPNISFKTESANRITVGPCSFDFCTGRLLPEQQQL
jgi:hypothetical protein